MRNSLTFALAAAVFFVGLAEAQAKDLKIGVVDVEYVIIKSQKGQAAKKRLKRIFKKKQGDLDKKQNTLLELKKRLENPSGMDSPEVRKKALIDYQQGIVKLQEDFVKHQKDLAKTEMKLMKPILKKLEEVLTTHAKTGNFDLILTRSQHGVVFAKPSMDITQDVLKRMDAP